LLFDDQSRLCGRRAGSDQAPDMVRASRVTKELAFSGVHVISPRFLELLTELDAFSIITSYLRLAAQDEEVLGFRADEYYWRDLGRSESITQAIQDVEQNILQL
jgi:MurNAc alpha-1-phosphate uridylyltransferase